MLQPYLHRHQRRMSRHAEDLRDGGPCIVDEWMSNLNCRQMVKSLRRLDYQQLDRKDAREDIIEPMRDGISRVLASLDIEFCSRNTRAGPMTSQ